MEQEFTEEHKKNLEGTQEQIKKAEIKLGDFTDNRQKAAPLPETQEAFPLNDLSPNQTRSQPLLHFSITENEKSIHKDYYHPISEKDLRKLNRYAVQLQEVATWYLNTVADSSVTYFYQEGSETNSVTINYNKDNFMHLTGVFPYREKQTAEQTLLDFVEGRGAFENILIVNQGATFDKLKVLPELPAIIESDSFYFNDLSDVEKFKVLDMDKAIRSNDKDVLLAFRTLDGATFPASLMRLKEKLNLEIDHQLDEKVILGVYRERNGKITQLSINEEYIHDNGQELMALMKQQVLARTIEEKIATIDLSDYRYFVEDERLWNQLVEQLPYANGTQESPIQFVDSTAEDCIGFISFNGSDEITIEQILAYFEEKGIDNLEERLTLLQQWQGEIETLGEEVSERIRQAEQELTLTEVKQPSTVSDFINARDYAGLKKHLQEGMVNYLQGDVFKAYLEFVSKLPSYSFRNVQLLYNQNPNITYVMGYKQWTELERFVKKGEKSLKIYKPFERIVKDKNGNPILDENGKEQKETFFKLVPVFDISQTDGKEVAKLIYNLETELNDPKLFTAMYQALKTCTTAKIKFVKFPEDNQANGYYLPETNDIIIRQGLFPVMTIKTLLHEITHSHLHTLGVGSSLERQQAEFEAESTAYIVANHFGIDTSEYTFGYLASWTSGGQDIEQFTNALERITNEARSLINDIEQVLEKNKQQLLSNAPQNKFEERVQLAKQKQASTSKAQEKPLTIPETVGEISQGKK